jgi:hypothetical protein
MRLDLPEYANDGKGLLGHEKTLIGSGEDNAERSEIFRKKSVGEDVEAIPGQPAPSYLRRRTASSCL